MALLFSQASGIWNGTWNALRVATYTRLQGDALDIDIVLFPHCDLHVSLDRPGPWVKVSLRKIVGRHQPYDLDPVTNDSTFDFYAPHAPNGQRFANLPRVENGQIIANTPGIYLFQCRYARWSIVGRLQVHQAMTDWWFGNDSITTAVDEVAHAQPTIYAQFSDDPDVGTDLVGDITGHGYIILASTEESTMTVNEHGRLQGLKETTSQPVMLKGTFRDVQGQLVQQQLPVRVVNYARRREILEPVVHDTVHDHTKAPNLLFLGEGFTNTTADKVAFDTYAEDIYMNMFIKPRHEPLGMLRTSMNVYKAPTASSQGLLTPGFRVADKTGHEGKPIPFETRIQGVPGNAYTVLELVRKVGLPKRGEQRTWQELKDDWATQHLDGYDGSKVDKDVVEAWKAQQSRGMLQARDTFFGLHLGQRLADRNAKPEMVDNPGPDGNDPEKLKAFVRRLYSFYEINSARFMELDPRRHPPELLAPGYDNPFLSIYQYIGGLAERYDLKRSVGPEWLPDQSRLRLSRGMVIVIANDVMQGGQNIENNGLACLTLSDQVKLDFAYGNPRPSTMRRKPVTFTYDQYSLTDVAVHELGHSFQLGDEYEEADADYGLPSIAADNLTTKTKIDRNNDGKIDTETADKFLSESAKWLDLMRVKLASRVLAIKALPDGAEVTVPMEDIPLWRKAAPLGSPKVYLRATLTSAGEQLPFTPENLITFQIVVSQTNATIKLKGTPPDLAIFKGGSVLILPVRTTGGDVIYVAEKPVLDHLRQQGYPINIATPGVNKNPDVPVSITGFTPPNPASRTIGVYEGGAKFSKGIYRPAGTCKMRDEHGKYDNAGAFCFVCQWLIVNRLNPALHRELDKTYPKGTIR